jgi:hypothetical protein
MQFWLASQRSVPRVVDHRVRDVAARAALDLHARDPLRRALRDPLLDHALAADPVVPAPQVHRAVLDEREHRVRDARVVVGQVGLRDPVVREQHLVGVRELDVSVGGGHR